MIRVIKSRRMRWAGHGTRRGRGEVFTWFWWGDLEGKRPLGRSRRRWKDNIKMDLGGLGIDERTGFGCLRIRSSGWIL
jgi:hypothetical protein